MEYSKKKVVDSCLSQFLNSTGTVISVFLSVTSSHQIKS